jgi:hypothetical protein
MVATATPPSSVDEDPLAMLDAMASGTKTRKKSANPTINRPELAASLLAWETNKAKEAHYKSLRETAEAQIIAAAAEERIKACRAARDVVTTVKLAAEVEDANGVRNASVSITQQCRYCDIKTEDPGQAKRLEQLKAALGSSFSKYVASEMSVSLSDAALADQTFLRGFVKLMMESYGAEEFGKRFVIKKALTPTKEFHRDYALDETLYAAVKPFMDDDTIRAFKPSVKQ